MFADFYKAIRWYLISVMAVGGFYFMYMANETNSMKPTLPMVLCFGFGYIFAYVWYKYKRPVQFASLIVFIGLGFLTLYRYEIIYIATGNVVDLNFHLGWLILNAVVGVPLMTVAFKMFD